MLLFILAREETGRRVAIDRGGAEDMRQRAGGVDDNNVFPNVQSINARRSTVNATDHVTASISPKGVSQDTFFAAHCSLHLQSFSLLHSELFSCFYFN